MLKPAEFKALKFIRESVARQGIPPTIREIGRHLNYKSSNSASRIIDKLFKAGHIHKRPNGRIQLTELVDADKSKIETVDVPIVGTAPCGEPLLAEQNIEGYVPVSIKLAKPGHQYFILKTTGTSMNKIIPENSFVLVKQQPAPDHNGQNVVALIDGEATIKSIYQDKGIIILKPKSTDKEKLPILVEEDFVIQGVIANILPKNLYELKNY